MGRITFAKRERPPCGLGRFVLFRVGSGGGKITIWMKWKLHSSFSYNGLFRGSAKKMLLNFSYRGEIIIGQLVTSLRFSQKKKIARNI